MLLSSHKGPPQKHYCLVGQKGIRHTVGMHYPWSIYGVSMEYPWTCNERNIHQRGTKYTRNRVKSAIALQPSTENQGHLPGGLECIKHTSAMKLPDKFPFQVL
jgi:hypothetical protein